MKPFQYVSIPLNQQFRVRVPIGEVIVTTKAEVPVDLVLT